MVKRIIRLAVPPLPLVAALAVFSCSPTAPERATESSTSRSSESSPGTRTAADPSSESSPGTRSATKLGRTHRHALLVGVNKYDHADLPALGYAVADVTELRDVLAKAGYEAVLLTADEARAKKDGTLAPTKGNFEARLRALVKKYQAGDTLLIGLAGHGLQFAGDEDGYFCPQDARPFKERADTLVSVKWIYQRLHQDAADGVKFLLVDACRNIPKTRGRGIDAGGTPAPPKGVGMLLSCAAGQVAFEGEDWGGGHGVFFHYVLEGLKGRAQDEEGAVTWDGLRSYVKKRVPKDRADQTPEEAGRLAGVQVLIDPVSEPTPERLGETIVLFNGKSLSGWHFHSNEAGRGVEEACQVKDALLVCKHLPYGYQLYAEQAFGDAVLRLDYRYPAGSPPPANGWVVALRAAGVNQPAITQARLKLGGQPTGTLHPASRSRDDGLPPLPGVKGVEKPAGQWNELRVTCLGRWATVRLNGQVINRQAVLPEGKGRFGLAPHKCDMEFRNVRVTTIKTDPPKH